jgi:hypothetical protein
MSKALKIARMLKPRQRQALEILAKAERPLRNKDFKKRFGIDGRRTTGWSKALGPCTKPRNHDPESLWARGLVKVIDNRYYKITPLGWEVAAAIESVAIRPTVRRKLPCADGAPAISSSDNSKEPSKLTPQAERPSEQLREFRSRLDKLLPSPKRLDEFERELVALIGRPTDLRPFVCEGSPLTCDVFLVGFNNATMMNTDFWEFWRPGYGYDKEAWFKRYVEERAARPLKPGKTRRQKVSPTRRNIECFVEGAAGVRVLETNIYAKASDDMKSLDPASRDIAPFSFLLYTVKPKVIVVHGKRTLEAIRKSDISAKLIVADHHFSRKTSKDTARRYGASAAKESAAAS